MFPWNPKIKQGNTVQTHVGIVSDCERDSKIIAGDQVIIPLLDAERAALDGAATVLRKEPFAVAGLEENAAAVEQRTDGCDFMLHGGTSLCELYETRIGEKNRAKIFSKIKITNL